jgi:hypothetical protein
MPNELQPQDACELQGRRIEAPGFPALVFPVDACRWVLADNMSQGYMIAAELATCHVPMDPTFLALVGGYVVACSVFYESGFGALHIDSFACCYSSMAWSCII